MATPRIGRSQEDITPKPQPEPEVEETVTITLEDAAELLAGMLPPDTLGFIREAAESLRVPMWQMLCGYAMNCADRMEIYSPHIMAAWAFGDGATRERTCGSCGQEFGSVFPDAKYCCSPCYFEKLSTLGHADDCPTKKQVKA